jgi:hypothetical protein
MKALNSASDRSPPASVWLVVMNDRTPPIVRSSVAPGVVADLRPSRNEYSMSFACSMPLLRFWRGHSFGFTWNPLACSDPEISSGVRKICVLLDCFVGTSLRAGLDVSFSGCADPMISSSSPELIAAAVDPMPRVTLMFGAATLSTRYCSPVRVFST